MRPDGTFSIDIDGDEASVAIEVIAAGLRSRRRTLVFRDGVADAGPITMTRLRNISVHSLAILKSAGAIGNHVDAIVQNDSDHAVDIASISLEGSKRAKTDCLDAMPGLSFTFADTLVAGRADVAVTERAKGPADAVMATGVVRVLACEQQQLHLAIAYPFQLLPGERTKLRLTVPVHMKVESQANPVLVDLETYESLLITFRTSDGVSTSVARRVPR